MKYMHFKALLIGHQNEQISVILSNFQKRAFYRLVYLHQKLWIFIKSPDFNEIKEITDFNQILKESLLPFSALTLKFSMFWSISCAW